MPSPQPVFQSVEHGGPRYRETLDMRDRILRAPLGLAFDEAEIAAEAGDFHLVAIDPESDAVIACLVLSPKSSELIHMRQVAVADDRRRSGVGRALSAFAERFATKHGFAEIKLHAREPVVGFYEKLGYVVRGESFEEVTIPHREMRKRIDPA